MDYNQKALELHEKLHGKIATAAKVSVDTPEMLSTAYTPGVAEPCRKIAANPEDVYKYTGKGNLVAVVTDGSAVLGLGNIGPEAALPVMEGKALLFKEFGDVDAVPICLDTQDTDEIINATAAIAPGFGGINLEDIAAPRCFEIEKRLQDKLSIPVFHDDQHGTAIVVSAAVINAARLAGKKLEDMKAVINGDGAAGSAIARMLLSLGTGQVLVLNADGILCPDDDRLDPARKQLAADTNPGGISGKLADALNGADVFVGVSVGNIVTAEMISKMADKAAVFAMANPTPEIMPEESKKGGAFIIGTGRSDYPNQINNVLAFPGIFKGALQARAGRITEDMKRAAAFALAQVLNSDELSTDKVLPDAFDSRVAPAVAQAVAGAWEGR
ncbi:MAG: NAD(P)-dependent malic enzyme [Eubacteriaceae bacterium]|jgi:malate dehydrogenase (oxaloacetate-decarboxylating)